MKYFYFLVLLLLGAKLHARPETLLDDARLGLKVVIMTPDLVSEHAAQLDNSFSVLPVLLKIDNRSKKPRGFNISFQYKNEDYSYRSSGGEQIGGNVSYPITVAAESQGVFHLQLPGCSRSASVKITGSDLRQVSHYISLDEPSDEVFITKGSEAFWNTDGSSYLVAAFTLEMLSSDWRGLTFMSSFALNTKQWESLTIQQREAIANWVFQGGVFHLHMPDTTRRAALKSTFPGLGEANLGKYNIGQGRLFLIDDQTQLVRHHSPQITNEGMFFSDGDNLLGMSFSRFGQGLAMAMALLMFIILGPVNFFVLTRKKNRSRLLYSTPLLAFALTFLMMIFIVLKDGFSIDGHRQVEVLVDESSNKMMLLQRNSLRSGIVLNSSVKQEESEMFCAYKVTENDSYRPYSEGHRQYNYSLEREDLTFQGKSLLPSLIRNRTNQVVDQKVLSTSRSRLQLNEEQGFSSTYSSDLLNVLFRRDGQLYFAEKISPGENAKAILVDYALEPGEKEITLRGGRTVELKSDYISRIPTEDNHYLAQLPEKCELYQQLKEGVDWTQSRGILRGIALTSEVSK